MNTEHSAPASAIGPKSPRRAFGRKRAALLQSLLSNPVLKPEERNFQAALLAESDPDEDRSTVLAHQPDYDDEDYGRGYD
jgi:hypothetical protein